MLNVNSELHGAAASIVFRELSLWSWVQMPTAGVIAGAKYQPHTQFPWCPSFVAAH